jgi:2-dehydro-3-deoxygluconokinase
MEGRSIDVIGFGETLGRLQANEDSRLEAASALSLFVGGAELNSCCTLSALGLRASLATVVPEGPLGRRVMRHAREAGVSVDLISSRPGRLGLYFVDFGHPPRSIEILYDRKDSAFSLRGHEIEGAVAERLDRTRCLLVTGITPALGEPLVQASLKLGAAAKQKGCLFAFDLNYRTRLWDREPAARALGDIAGYADILIATEEDLGLLFGWVGEPRALAQKCRDRFSSRVVVITRGAEGAFGLFGDVERTAASFNSVAVDRIGAGDAFTGGLLYALLTNREDVSLDIALACAALKRSMPGDALVTHLAEMEQTLTRDSREIRR